MKLNRKEFPFKYKKLQDGFFGMCSPDGTFYLDSRLKKYSEKLQKAVLFHEYAHAINNDHERWESMSPSEFDHYPSDGAPYELLAEVKADMYAEKMIGEAFPYKELLLAAKDMGLDADTLKLDLQPRIDYPRN